MWFMACLAQTALHFSHPGLSMRAGRPSTFSPQTAGVPSTQSVPMASGWQSPHTRCHFIGRLSFDACSSSTYSSTPGISGAVWLATVTHSPCVLDCEPECALMIVELCNYPHGPLVSLVEDDPVTFGEAGLLHTQVLA